MLITVHLPDEIAHYEPDLRFVFETMVRKLYVNREKGFAENMSFIDAVMLVDDEAEELRTALREESQMAFFGEAVVVANTGVLAALVALRNTKKSYNECKAKFEEGL